MTIFAVVSPRIRQVYRPITLIISYSWLPAQCQGDFAPEVDEMRELKEEIECSRFTPGTGGTGGTVLTMKAVALSITRE